jgi:growth factor-regulated tyrosine kinase substrate
VTPGRALSALREEHREKLRGAAEEAERQRQLQLAQKLELMRQKKQEYLEFQRQLAIQRLQEQKERQMRLEQQKQTVQMRAQMPAFPLPYAQLQAMPSAGVLYQPSGPMNFPGTFSPAGSVEGFPMHGVYMSQPAPAAGPYSSIPSNSADPSMVSASWGTDSPPGPRLHPPLALPTHRMSPLLPQATRYESSAASVTPVPCPAFSPIALLPFTECDLPVPTESPSHLPATTVWYHGLYGESVSVHGLPAL